MKPAKMLFKDKALAQYWGRVGGRVKSETKIRAIQINALKHGKYSKDPILKSLITPTPTEKMVGITHSDKIKQLKQINSFFGAENIIEATEGAEETIAISEVQLARWRTELDQLSKQDLTNLSPHDRAEIKKRILSLENKIFYGALHLTSLKNQCIDRKFGKNPNLIANILNVQQTQINQKIAVSKILNAIAGVKDDD